MVRISKRISNTLALCLVIGEENGCRGEGRGGCYLNTYVVAYFRERIGIPCFASHIDKGVDSK